MDPLNTKASVVQDETHPINLNLMPSDLLKRIFSCCSPFECLTLMPVSENFKAVLLDNSFWIAKLANLIQPDPECGLSMRSQFVLRAIFEIQLMKECRGRDKTFVKRTLELKDYKMTLINTVEMAKKAAHICQYFLECIDQKLKSDRSFIFELKEYPVIFKYADKKLMADKSFIFELIKIPQILDYASDEIKNDKKMKHLLALNFGSDNLTIGQENAFQTKYLILQPAQKALLIRELTESIKADIAAEKSAKIPVPTVT